MPWEPLPRLAFAVCTYPFSPSGPHDLPLQIGDELYIIEQTVGTGAWFRGYLVAQPSLLAGLTTSRGQSLEKRVFTGIFPAACVEIRELLGDDNPKLPESRESSEETSVDDAKYTIRRKPLPLKGLSSNAGRDDGSVTQAVSGQNEQTPAESSPDKSDLSTEPFDAKDRTKGARLAEDAANKLEKSRKKPPAPVPMLKISDESSIAKDEPLVDEIASCLREWQSTRLHELLLNRHYRMLHQMSSLVNRLDSIRKQLLHKILTDAELDKLREQAVWDLSRGNKLLSGGVIVRSKEHRGRILTSDDSAIEVTKLQAMMSLLDDKPHHHADIKSLNHLYVDLKTFSSDSEKPTWLDFALYSKRLGQAPQLLSECFSVDVKNKPLSSTITFEGTQKTLFTDIAGTDVGEGPNEQSSVFLVVKMITNEPQYQRRPSASTPPSSRNGPSTNVPRNLNAIRTGSVRNPSGGRQSLMWGRKTRKDSEHAIAKPHPLRSDTNTSQRSQTIEARDKPPNEVEKHEKPLKRVTGFAIINVSRYVRDLKPKDVQADLRPLTTVFEDGSLGGDDERQVAAEALGSTADNHPVWTRGSLELHLKAFENPNAADLIQKTPTLFHNISISNRLGFAGAPRKPRSDIYVTLRMPNISNVALLSHPKDGNVPVPPEVALANMVLTLEVHAADGKRIPNAIWPASSRNGHDAWRTYAIEQGGSWNQTIRLAVEPDQVPGSHIVMSVSEDHHFPYALCWMPLWSQGAFIRDGEHSLALHRYDDTTSAMRGGKGAYLSLPWEAHRRDEAVTGHLASLRLETYLCSTSYSQDPNLLGLLHWKDQSPQDILKLLKQFPFVPEIETVKLLKDVFNALFGIVVQYSENDDVEDLVFDGLVTVLSIVHDRRFNLQPIVDEYATNDFAFPFAFPCLLRSFGRLLDHPASPQMSRRLRAAFKNGAYLLKFLIKARQQQVQKEVDIGISSHRPTFAKDLHVIFAGIDNLMRNSNPVLVGTKTLAVQNFHMFLPELRGVMNSEEILTIATNFINTLSDAQGKLILYEILLIQHISEANLFPGDDTQQEWVSNVFDWLEPYWGKAENYTPQWRDQIRLCCSVVATLFDKYGPHTAMWVRKLIESYKVVQTMPRPASHTFSLLFPTSYPFPTRSVTGEAKYDEALLEISALLSASSTLTAKEFPKRTLEEMAEVLLSVLHVSKSVLNFEAFPSNWISVHIYHHRSCLRFLHALFGVLTTKFLPLPDDADSFNDQLWRSYLNMLLQLVSSKVIALEAFSEQRRRAIWKICGDIRESGAALLQESWQALAWEADEEDRITYGLERVGGYQVSFIPGLIGPIVELCLHVHDNLRSVAVSILHSMIIGEWTLNGNLDTIQTNMITSIDKLYKSQPLNDGMTQKPFIDELKRYFNKSPGTKDKRLMETVNNLLETVSELLDLLVAVYLPDSVGETHQIYESIRLLEYYKALGKIDIYVDYVHRLSDMQANAKHYTEAGLALRLHAELLEWDSLRLLPASTEPRFPVQTAFERKEQIYLQMMKFFEEASAWVYGLDVYRELADQYLNNVFDFFKLARAERAMATIFEKIGKGERQTPRFFRVHFRGLGFSSSLRDRQFIYEASPNERLSSFTDKMHKQYPNAQIIGTNEVEELEGQYISVFSISPRRDLHHASNRRIKIPQPVKEYFMTATPSEFANTTRKQPGNHSVHSQVQEKTIYTTADKFPNILRRSEIIDVKVSNMAPTDIGVERTLRKTNELQALTRQAQEGAETAMNALTDMLMLLVNEASVASVARYWELIEDDMLGDDASEESGGDSVMPDGFERANTRASLEANLSPEKQALLFNLVDHVLAIRSALECYHRSAHQATGAELTKDLENTFAPLVAYMQRITPSPPNADDDENQTHHQTERQISASRKPAALHERKQSMASARAGVPEIDTKKAQQLSPLPNSIQNTPRMSEPASPTSAGAKEDKNRDKKGKTESSHSGRKRTSEQEHSKSSKKSPSRPISGKESSTEEKKESGKKEGSGLHPQASLHSLQARMGSVTKRLSHLNVAGTTFKAKASPTITETEAP